MIYHNKKRLKSSIHIYISYSWYNIIGLWKKNTVWIINHPITKTYIESNEGHIQIIENKI